MNSDQNRGKFVGIYGLRDKPNHRTPIHEKAGRSYDIFDREVNLKKYTKRA